MVRRWPIFPSTFYVFLHRVSNFLSILELNKCIYIYLACYIIFIYCLHMRRDAKEGEIIKKLDKKLKLSKVGK